MTHNNSHLIATHERRGPGIIISHEERITDRLDLVAGQRLKESSRLVVNALRIFAVLSSAW